MRLIFAIAISLFFISCTHKQTLTEQLKHTFSDHLKQIDSAAVLDSVHILWNAAVTQRLGRTFDDSMYVREFTRIKTQLANAQQKNDRDSIEFYQYEINNIEKGVDSVTKSIPEGDTTKKYGYLIGCAYYIAKNGKTKTDSTILFVEPNSIMRYTEFLDSSLHRTIKSFH
jgi:hypothetical protein